MRNEEDLKLERDISKRDRTDDQRAYDSKIEQEKIGRMKDKDVERESKEILSRDSDSKLSSRDKYILERESKIVNSQREEIRRNQIELIDKIKTNSHSKGDIRKLRESDKEMISKNNFYNKIEDRLHPERIEQKNKNSFNEKFRECVARIEKESVHISDDKIYAKSKALDDARDSNKAAIALALDICKYRAFAGRDIANETKTDISRFYIKTLDEKNVEKFELDKLAVSKNPDAIRNFYESGLRVNDEKLKPEQINNAINLCKQLPKDNYQAKIEVMDRLVTGRIQNTKLDEKSLEKLAEKYDKIGREREKNIEVDKQVKNVIERDDHNREESNSLRDELLKEPKKFEENIVKLLITSKPDIDDLKSIQKNVDKIVTREPYEIKSDDLRAMIIKNPQNVLELRDLNITLPDKLEINRLTYTHGVSLLNEMNEKNNIIRLTVLSSSIKDPKSDDIKIGNKEENIKIKELLNKNFSDEKDIKEVIKQIRQDLKDEKINNLKENPVLDISKLDSKQAAREISVYVGLMCEKDSYTRREVVGRLDNAKEDIKNNSIDIRSLDTKDKCLRDEDLVKIVSRDPQLLVNIQRMGIHLTRNGDINEEKLQERIDLIKQIDEKDSTLRLAVLSTCMVRTSQNRVTIDNPINLMDSEKNKEVKALAIKIVADEKHIKFESDKYKESSLRELKLAKERFDVIKKEEKIEKLHLKEAKLIFSKYENINLLSLSDNDKLKSLTINPSLSDEEKAHTINNYHKEIEKQLIDLRNQSIDYVSSNLIFDDRYESLMKNISLKTHELIEREQHNINSIGSLSYKDLDKISKMTEPRQSDEKSILTYSNRNNERMDATARYIVLSACDENLRLPFDGLSKNSIDEFKLEVDSFKSYISLVTGSSNPLDNRVPEELVKGYFNNERYRSQENINYLEREDIKSLPQGEEFSAKALFLDKIGLLKNNEVLYNEKNCFIKDTINSNSTINELYEEIDERFSKGTNWTSSTIKDELKTVDDLKEKYKEVPERYQKKENDKLIDDRSYNIRALDKIEKFDITISVDASRFSDISLKADDFYNAGLNCRYIYPSNGNDSIIEIGNINTYSISTLDETSFNDLRNLVMEFEPDKVAFFDDARQPESNTIKEINLLIRDFSDYERYVDKCYKENSIDIASEKAYEKFAEIRRPLDDKIKDIVDFKETTLNETYEKNIVNDLNEYQKDFLQTYAGYENRYQEELALSKLIEEEKLEKNSHIAPDGIDLSLFSERNIDNAPYWTATDMLSYNNDRFDETNLLQDYYKDIIDAQSQIKVDMEAYGLEFFTPLYDFKSDSIQILDPSDGNEKIYEYKMTENGPITNGDYSKSEVIDIENREFAKNLYDKITEIKQNRIDELNSIIDEKNQNIVNSSIFEHGTDEIREYINTPFADNNGENDDLKFSASEILTAIEELKEIEERTINDELIKKDIDSPISSIISEDAITEYLYSLTI